MSCTASADARLNFPGFAQCFVSFSSASAGDLDATAGSRAGGAGSGASTAASSSVLTRFGDGGGSSFGSGAARFAAGSSSNRPIAAPRGVMTGRRDGRSSARRRLVRQRDLSLVGRRDQSSPGAGRLSRAMPVLRKARPRSEDVALDEELTFQDLQLPVRVRSPASRASARRAHSRCSLRRRAVRRPRGRRVPRPFPRAARGDPPRPPRRGPRRPSQVRHGQDGRVRRHPPRARRPRAQAPAGCRRRAHARGGAAVARRRRVAREFARAAVAVAPRVPRRPPRRERSRGARSRRAAVRGHAGPPPSAPRGGVDSPGRRAMRRDRRGGRAHGRVVRGGRAVHTRRAARAEADDGVQVRK
eukprot:31150-Pelagococcus_subviridis.AAC.6